MRKLLLCIILLCSLTMGQSSEAANHALEIIFPRSTADVATSHNVWSRAYPGLKYNLRMAVYGGDYPFTYSLTTAPAGMTIDANTGEITWPSPTSTGSPHTVTAQVVDRGTSGGGEGTGGTAVSVTWTITVPTTEQCATVNATCGYLFVDAVNGHRSAFYGGTGTGTLANPFRTIADWYCSVLTTDPCTYPGSGPADDKNVSTYSGYFIYYRTGTYFPFRTEGGLRLNMEFDAKPLVWLAYPGDTPIIDVSNGYLLMSGTSNDRALVGLEIKNPGAGSDYLTINWGQGRGRGYVWRNVHHELPAGCVSVGCSDNQSLFMLSGTSTSTYYAILDSQFYNVARGYGVLGYGAYKVIIEGNTFHNVTSDRDNAGYPLAMKESTMRWDIRANTFYTNAFFHIHNLESTSHGPVGDHEIRYNRTYGTNQRSLSDGAQCNPISAVYIYRNTFVGTVDIWCADTGDGPWAFSKNVIINNDSGDTVTDHVTCNTCTNLAVVTRSNDLTGTTADGIVNSTGALQGAYRTTYLGTRGYELGTGGDVTPPAAPTGVMITKVMAGRR